MNSTRKNR